MNHSAIQSDTENETTCTLSRQKTVIPEPIFNFPLLYCICLSAFLFISNILFSCSILTSFPSQLFALIWFYTSYTFYTLKPNKNRKTKHYLNVEWILSNFSYTQIHQIHTYIVLYTYVYLYKIDFLTCDLNNKFIPFYL